MQHHITHKCIKAQQRMNYVTSRPDITDLNNKIKK